MILNRQRKLKINKRPLEELEKKLREEFNIKVPLSVVLVSDRKISQMNRQYRGKEGPTDVLSFYYNDPHYLGDIIISVETALKQAEEMGHSIERELKILLIHGFLHLLGYDHETDNGEMRKLERKLWKKYL